MSPETLAKLTSLNLLVKDGYSKVTASLTIFNSVIYNISPIISNS